MNRTPDELFKDLFKIVEELGWQVGIPKINEDENVPGLIIGTGQYIDDVTAGKYAETSQVTGIKENDNGNEVETEEEA